MPDSSKIENNTGLPETATGKALAELLGITDRQVRNLADEGIVKRAGRGRYLLAESIRAVVAQAEKKASSAVDAEKASLIAARRRAIEIQNARNDGLLVPVEEVDFTLATVLGGIKSDLLGLAARVTRDMSLRRAIDAEVIRILNASAKRAKDHAATAEAALADADDET